MIINATAWELITLQAIEDELWAMPWNTREDVARALCMEIFQLVVPTDAERTRPN